MGDELTAHQLSKMLREGTEDYDTFIDINTAIASLSKQNREFIILYAKGYSVRGAAMVLKMKNNPQRLFNRLIKNILTEVNGNATNSTDRTNVLRKDHTSQTAIE